MAATDAANEVRRCDGTSLHDIGGVKLIDLTPVGAVVVTESKPKKVKAEKIKLARSR